MSWPRLFPRACLTLFAFLALVSPPHAQEKKAGDQKTEDQKVSEKIAVIRVRLPPNALLKIDDFLAKQTGPERVFHTPDLQPGRTFEYTLRATWKNPLGGREIVRMAVARVEAGKETLIDMNENSADATSSQIVYVPTPQAVVDKMLAMAKVTKDDIVYDLGCGDGRLVVTAAKKFGARGVGVDIDPARIKDSLANVKKEKVEKLVEIRQGDALKVADLSKATVVMLYMLPEFMEKLKPILLKELKPGTRIVAHDYPIPGLEPLEKATIARKLPISAPHTLYLWQVEEKEKKKGKK